MRTRAPFILLAMAALGCEPHVEAPPAPPPTSVALFDPLGTPPVVPTPTDLVRVDGRLNPPDVPGQSAAQTSFNAYLRQLDGFPAGSTPTTRFSTALDAKRVTLSSPTAPGAIIMVDATAMQPLGADAITPSLSADGKTLTLAPTQPFAPGHTYAVALFGGSDAHGLVGAHGEQVIASPTFYFLRAPVPLLARCADAGNPGCACPDATDPSCHSSVLGLSDAAARQAEPQRQQVQAALRQLLPLLAPGRQQSDVVLFWTFTITTQPMTVFDPASGNIPFPNDVLIDQKTGLVKLPVTPGDPLAMLAPGLNTLDGFSVSAPVTIGTSGPAPIDAKTVLPGLSVELVPLTPKVAPPTIAATAQFDQIAIQPVVPLASDQAQYAAVVTTLVADASGKRLLPSPAMWLAIGPDPLVANGHTTVSALSDAQAAQLEMLRKPLQPLVQALAAKGVPRTLIAGLWTFTTQSIVRPNGACDAFPAAAGLPTDVTLTATANAAQLQATFGASNFLPHVKVLVLGTFRTREVTDPATGLVLFDRAGNWTLVPPAQAPSPAVPFWLTLPDVPGPVPVAIVQHGLGSWRGDILPLAEGLARAGWAAVGFDIDFHGARSHCTSDADCASGRCTGGTCPGGFVPMPAAMDPLACDLAAVSHDPRDCRPLVSGQGYINPANLFTARSNGQQYIVDAAQLVRVLSDAQNGNALAGRLAAAGITPAVAASKLGFIGQSLGGIDGAVFVSVAPEPRVAVFNVTGGHLFDVISTSPTLHAPVDQLLASLGIMRGTAQYARVDALAAWIVDPADPFSVSPSLSGRPNIVQEAGMDQVIPPPFQEDLAFAIFGTLDAQHHAEGRDAQGNLVSTYFPTAQHGDLLAPNATGAAEQTQALGFLTTFGALLPPPQ